MAAASVSLSVASVCASRQPRLKSGSPARSRARLARPSARCATMRTSGSSTFTLGRAPRRSRRTSTTASFTLSAVKCVCPRASVRPTASTANVRVSSRCCLPADVASAGIQRVGVGRGEIGERQQHPHGDPRPQAGAHGVADVARESHTAPADAHTPQLERLQFVGEQVLGPGRRGGEEDGHPSPPAMISLPFSRRMFVFPRTLLPSRRRPLFRRRQPPRRPGRPSDRRPQSRNSRPLAAVVSKKKRCGRA